MKTRHQLFLSHPPIADQARPKRTATSVMLPVATTACAIAIFIADTVTDVDIAVASLYAAVVLMAARFSRARGIVGTAAACVGLTVLSYYLSPPGGPEIEGVVNTLISLAVIVFTTVLAVQSSAAHAAVRASEEEWREVFEHNPTMYFMLDSAGVVLSVNSFGAAQLGYTVDELVGRSVLAVFPESDRPSVQRNVALCLETLGRSHSWEGRKVCKNGTVLWVRENAKAIRRSRNDLIVLVACEDITERKQAEADLRASEERWRTVFETAAVGIAIVRRDLRFAAANPAYQRKVGYTEDELKGMTVADLTYEDDRAATRKHLDAIIAGPSRSYRVEKRYVRKDGAIIWVDVNISLIPATEGTPSFFAGMVVDITARKRAEEALRRSETFLAEAQRIGRIGTYRRSITTGEVFWSDETFRIYGFDPGQKPALEPVLQRIHPEDRPRVREYLARTEPRDWEIEFRLLMPDGTIKYCRALSRTSKDASGNLERIGAVIDITAVKQAEAELNQARTEIARVSRVLTLGELTAAIAHEINQPLAAVVADGSAGLHWLDGDPPNLPEVRQTLARVVKNANRAADVIARIRAMARKSPLRMEQLDVNELIQDVIALTRSELDRNRIALHTRLADGLPPVQGDRVQLQQVILNLIMNAIEAMSGGEPRELQVASERDEPQHVLVSVEDSGCGFDPAMIDRMFDTFHTTKSGGMGMGLAISRSIVERHGGRLWASANVPRGAVFRFVLPAGQGSDRLAASTAWHEPQAD